MNLKRLNCIFISLLLILPVLITACGNRNGLLMNKQMMMNNLPQARVEFDESGQSVPNQYIIKGKGSSYLATPQEFGQKYGITVLKEIHTIGLELVNIPAGSASTVVGELRSNPEIEFVEPNYIRHIPAGTTESAGQNQFNATSAWNSNPGRSFVKIAVIDTGVDTQHPDLQGKLTPGYSVFGNDEKDENGHGTYLAGIISGSNEQVGVKGVAPSCKVMPVKVLNKNGYGTDFDIAEGIAWSVDHGANVICLNAGSSTKGNAISRAIYAAHQKSVPVVVGMGNKNSGSQWYPSTDQGVISVSALDINNSTLASFSNSGEWVTLSAPGVGVKSTLPTSQNSYGTTNYGTINSTSTAAAHVAGMIALIKSQQMDISVNQLKDILIKNSDDIGPRGFDPQFGGGRMNIMRALNVRPIASSGYNSQRNPVSTYNNYNTYKQPAYNNNTYQQPAYNNYNSYNTYSNNRNYNTYSTNSYNRNDGIYRTPSSYNTPNTYRRTPVYY